MLAIPMGLIGVVWGHLALGLDLTMPSLVGFATLAGVVVNNNILLVTFVKHRLEEGAGIVEATLEAARDRFRPIMITSLTTIAGLLPLLTETSTQAQLLISAGRQPRLRASGGNGFITFPGCRPSS